MEGIFLEEILILRRILNVNCYILILIYNDRSSTLDKKERIEILIRVLIVTQVEKIRLDSKWN